MKRFLSIFFSVLFLCSVMALSACGGSGSSSGSGGSVTVGVSMPTQSLQRWNQDGANIKKQLEAKGYQVDLQYANNDVNTQMQQLENMITKGDKILVISAVDGSALTSVLQDAASNKVKVIAYDRLIMNTVNVDYYVSFDNYKVGVMQGQYIETQLGLKEGKGPFHIELFAGDPADNNAVYFNNGAMSVLKPYIASGKLIVTSGQVDFEKVAIATWDSSKAQARMDNLITAYYAKGTKLDAILSPNDSLAIGIVASLKSNGYGSGSKPYPLLTGQDCDTANVKAILAGQQSMSIFKDTRKEAAQAIDMVNALEQNKTAPVNDTKSYNNGTKVVPTYLLSPIYVDKSNYKSILVDSGYYTAAQLQ